MPPLTAEQCRALLSSTKSNLKNPLTGRKIVAGKALHKKLVNNCEHPKSSASPVPRDAHKIIKKFESMFQSHVKATTECRAKLAKAEDELAKMRAHTPSSQKLSDVKRDRDVLRNEAEMLHARYNETLKQYTEATQKLADRDAIIELMEARIKHLMNQMPEKARAPAVKRVRSSPSPTVGVRTRAQKRRALGI